MSYRAVTEQGARLDHSSTAMTMDTYGHLFPRGDDADELRAAEAAFLRAV
jgi:hypothetical protein